MFPGLQIFPDTLYKKLCFPDTSELRLEEIFHLNA